MFCYRIINNITNDNMTNITEVENRIITLRGQQVIIDADVAELYGVATRDINKAVKNNPEKFPDGYVLDLNTKEKMNWWKISTGSIVRNIQHQFPKPLPRRASICWLPS